MSEQWEFKEPSEAEMAEFEVQRARRDKISKRIGDFLLLGHCMLSKTCPECGVWCCFAASPGGTWRADGAAARQGQEGVLHGLH